MPFPNLSSGNIFSVKPSCWTLSQIGINVLHYRVVSHTGVGVTELEAATFFDGLLSPLLANLLYNGATYLGTGVRNLSSIPPSAGAVSTVGTTIGSRGPNPLPLQTSGLIKLITGFSGRSKRGRIYVPFPSNSDNTVNDTPTLAYVTNLAFYGSALTSAGAIGGTGGTIVCQMVIKPRVGFAVTDVIGGISREGWATQRRRGFFGRPNPPIPAV
jgi:hypothetical protein